MLIQMKRFDMAELVLAKAVGEKPDDLKAWLDLAAVRVGMKQNSRAIEALQKAIEKGGEPIRNVLRKDPRFKSLWNDPKFQKMVPPPAAKRLPFGAAPQPAGGFGGLSY